VTKKKDDVCPFCRTPMPTSAEEAIKSLKKRIEVNDAHAMIKMGCHSAGGQFGLPQNMAKALELWHRAGDLGYPAALYNIGNSYKVGNGVERDMKKALHYWELAAMSGSLFARHNLGANSSAGYMDRALKHFMMAASYGYFDSLKSIKTMYQSGHATKDDYAKALRSYQANLEEIKSDQRDEAAAYNDENKYYKSAA